MGVGAVLPGYLVRTDRQPISLTESPKADRNFILWTLIPYIAAWSGEKLMDENISFEEVATIRPDGAHNIFHASVVPDEMILPEDYVYMKNWCGPMWNGNGERIKVKYQTEFDALKAPYAEAVLESLPAHLRKVKEYELQVCIPR